MNQPLPPPTPGMQQGNPYPSQVSKLNMASAKMQRYKLLLRRRWWLLLLAASIGICIQAWQVSNKPTRYISHAKLVAGGRINVTHGPQYQEYTHDFYGTAMEIMRSGEVRKRASDRVEALHPDLKQVPVALRVERPTGASILDVSATGNEPKYTVEYLNSLLDEFISYRKEMRSQTTDITLNSITEELLRLEKLLKGEESKLTDFLENNSLLVLEHGGNEAADYLRSLNAQKTSLETELALLDLLDLDSDLERRQAMSLEQMAANTRNSTAESSPDVGGRYGGHGGHGGVNYRLGHAENSYLGARGEADLLSAKRLSLLKNLQPRHPTVIAMDEQIQEKLAIIDVYRGQSMQASARRVEGMKVRLQNLDNQILKYEAIAKSTQAQLSKHARINGGLDRIRKRYDGLLTLLQDIDVNEGLAADYISIMERAGAAAETEPDLIRPILTGLLLGLLAGLLIIIVFDKLDDRMNSFSEFQAHFSEDVLGQIPEQNMRGELGLIRPNDERHLYAEAFRNIRSSILFKNWGGKPPKTVIVTSAVPNEGKTTTAANLAITMALSGARVLLVDSDLRRGGLNEIMGMPSTPGLSEVLTDRSDWKSVARQTETENLEFIPRGEALDQTSEYLLSQRCTDFLRETSESYDFVIFDSAPVLVADDTASFAPKADTTLFVVRMSSTMARLAAKAMGQLYDRQVNVGGVILNRASTSLKEYSYYNYANYYTIKPTESEAPAEGATS